MVHFRPAFALSRRTRTEVKTPFGSLPPVCYENRGRNISRGRWLTGKTEPFVELTHYGKDSVLEALSQFTYREGRVRNCKLILHPAALEVCETQI
jgi:hypothetical protein